MTKYIYLEAKNRGGGARIRTNMLNAIVFGRPESSFGCRLPFRISSSPSKERFTLKAVAPK